MTNVLPVPLGPNSRTDFGGFRFPVNRSGRKAGTINAFANASLTSGGKFKLCSVGLCYGVVVILLNS